MRLRLPSRWETLSRWHGAYGVALYALLILLFLVACRGAYKGYFQDDELDNIFWTRYLSWLDYGSGLLAPRFFEHNFRPLGHLFFKVMGQWAGLEFRWYVAAVHTLHLVNVGLLWLAARKLGFARPAAGAACVFFAFHMGVFEACWKPMYVFDVLCALFALASLVCYLGGRWVLSLALFWLAYKAKEPAVMLPLALAAYEYLLDEKRWRRLIPFFAVSAVYSLQALRANRTREDAYTLRLGWQALATTAAFYAGRLLLLPYAGLALPAVPAFTRDRRAWFGLLWAAAFLAPMLALPGRLSGAYLYLPLAGVGLILASVPRLAAALFLAFWIPFNYAQMRVLRRAELAGADARRAYTGALIETARSLPDTRTFLVDGAPAGMNVWGIEGILGIAYGRRVEVLPAEEAQKAASGDVALLSWDAAEGKLYTVRRGPESVPAPYITMTRQTPVWQLTEGWYGRDGHFRWTQPVARARLYRPEGARLFELVVNAGPGYMAAVKRGEVEVRIDGRMIGTREVARVGWQTLRWPLPPEPAGVVEVTLRVRPELREGPGRRVLGIPVGALGFPEK